MATTASTGDSTTLEVRIIDEQSGRLLLTFYNVPEDHTVGDMKRRLYNTYNQFAIARQRFKTKANKHLADDVVLNSLEIKESCVELYFKDLGPQISWRGVFIAEYMGPLLIYSLFALFPKVFYASDTHKRYMGVDNTMLPEAKLAWAMWTLHYAKRVLESVFVHRFSRETMPLLNLFKNCAYYWGFGTWIGYLVNHPLYSGASTSFQVWTGAILFLVAEYGNAQCHLLLRDLRPREEGNEARKIPYPNGNPMTLMFDLVSCPNYTYEVLSWIGFSMVTQCFAAMVFCVVGLVQMAVWAKSKHRRYLKEFPGYPRQRKAMIPFLF